MFLQVKRDEAIIKLTDGSIGQPFFGKAYFRGVVAQKCNTMTLQPEQSAGVGSTPSRTPPIEHDDKGSWTQ